MIIDAHIFHTFFWVFFGAHTTKGLCKWVMKYGGSGVWNLPRFQFISGRRLRYANSDLYSFHSSVVCVSIPFPFCLPLSFPVNPSYCLLVYLLEDSGLIRPSLVVIMRSCPISSSPTCTYIYLIPPVLKYRR